MSSQAALMHALAPHGPMQAAALTEPSGMGESGLGAVDEVEEAGAQEGAEADLYLSPEEAEVAVGAAPALALQAVLPSAWLGACSPIGLVAWVELRLRGAGGGGPVRFSPDLVSEGLEKRSSCSSRTGPAHASSHPALHKSPPCLPLRSGARGDAAARLPDPALWEPGHAGAGGAGRALPAGPALQPRPLAAGAANRSGHPGACSASSARHFVRQAFGGQSSLSFQG